jgi:hypothetical protein
VSSPNLPVAHAGPCATGKLGGNKIQYFFEILDLPIAHHLVRYGYTIWCAMGKFSAIFFESAGIF